MTYRELLKVLTSLDPARLNDDAVVEVGPDEYYPIGFHFVSKGSDVFDDGHLILSTDDIPPLKG